MVVGKSGNAWFYPTNIPNPGDEIKVTDSKDWDKAGEGFGGSTLRLDLEGNQVYFDLKGGWHSNGHGLLDDTGVDLTQYHFTRCVIAEKFLKSYPEVEVVGVLYKDDDWTLGDYDRADKLAKIYANEMNKSVYLAKQSLGGGSYGTVQPDKGE